MKHVLKIAAVNLLLALPAFTAPKDPPCVEEVDALAATIARNTQNSERVAVIDHARLAIDTGVPMPPSILSIFSNPEVNTQLVAAHPLLGLDLPLKVLAYAEPGAAQATVAYADAEFLMRRHGMTDSSLFQPYEKTLMSTLAGIPKEIRIPVNTEGVEEGFGIIQMTSAHTLPETIIRLKNAILGQGDTVWFGQVDFQKDAVSQGVQIPGSTLLLFGGPKPGGLAMAEFPKLGLDAFCQKLLVYEAPGGSVKIAFNDIVKLAELHYGESNKPQQVINTRLSATCENAIK